MICFSQCTRGSMRYKFSWPCSCPQPVGWSVLEGPVASQPYEQQSNSNTQIHLQIKKHGVTDRSSFASNVPNSEFLQCYPRDTGRKLKKRSKSIIIETQPFQTNVPLPVFFLKVNNCILLNVYNHLGQKKKQKATCYFLLRSSEVVWVIEGQVG